MISYVWLSIDRLTWLPVTFDLVIVLAARGKITALRYQRVVNLCFVAVLLLPSDRPDLGAGDFAGSLG